MGCRVSRLVLTVCIGSLRAGEAPTVNGNRHSLVRLSAGRLGVINRNPKLFGWAFVCWCGETGEDVTCIAVR